MLLNLKAKPKEIPGTVDLSGAWKMKDFQPGGGKKTRVYLPGREPKDCLEIGVPATVRTALLAAGKIPDPYFGYDNEKSLWVEEKEWWFFKKFTLDAKLKGKWIDIVFEGFSFQGDAWVNGKPVGELRGMLNPKAFDVSGLLNYGGENAIAVRLAAPDDASKNKRARGLTWDTPRDQLFSIAQCMYGWDWGPHGLPVGLWRPVKLRISGPLRINGPYVRSRISSPALALLDISMEVANKSDQSKEGRISGTILDDGTNGKAAEFLQAVKLGPNEVKTVDFIVKIRNPKLWWPNGMGAQNMYWMLADLSESGSVSESIKTHFGIRELKLVENENVEEFLKTMKEHSGSVYHLGKVVGSYPWTFQVNGKRMFAKGGNWIPVDQLLRLDRDRYDRLLSLAKEAHFNLLRVWGGGLYETEDFYDLCDRYGILAWQEFLSNRNFSKIDRTNFLEGAESAVLRIRNHPSLTFWCGGNEFDPDDKGSKAVVDLLDSLLKRRDPGREFHRASPYMGDDHYWGVWHGLEPYTKYRIVRPFRSESGVNAFPVSESYKRFTPQNLLWPPDATFIEYHGEYNTRFLHLKKLTRYTDEFGPSSSIENLVMKSELVQALANSFNMEFCRANKFRNSGLLVWQYNDIWPCLSWSMVDWYGEPKPSYYYQKRASRPMHISVDFDKYLWKTGETFKADVHLLNDTDDPVKGSTYSIKLLNVHGKALAVRSGAAETPANRSAKIGSVELPIPMALAGKTIFVTVELFGRDGVKTSEALYPVAVSRTGDPDDYRNIFTDMNAMPPVGLKAKPKGSGIRLKADGTGSCSIVLENPTDKIAFFVRLRLEGEAETLTTTYDDNFFSILPGESKTVNIKIRNRDAKTAAAAMKLKISGWNCPAVTAAIPVAR
jgi:beta-mannosidase